MNARLKLARGLVRNGSIAASEKARQLTRLTAEVRQDYDRQILAIRSEISGHGFSASGAMWRSLRGLLGGVPFDRVATAAVVARLRIELAEAHTAKFAALAELKLLKAFA